jgi:hypothetical protein
VKVVHVLLEGATRYDRACAAIDATAGPNAIHETFETTPDALRRGREPSSVDELERALREASLLHLHGSSRPPKRLLAGLTIPWISDRALPIPWTLFRRIPEPATVLSQRSVPEAVGNEWFVDAGARASSDGRKHAGSLVRNADVRNSAEQSYARIQRFREDVEWTFFEEPPTPAELASLDLWIDPAADDDDLDGMVVEAIACRTLVAAARTPANARRLDDGRAGLLCPPGDHNEMTHAVMNALFKDEISEPRRHYAERIRDRFRPHRRQAVVLGIYEEVCR